MKMIETDGKDMLLREQNLMKFMVQKAPLLIASPSYAKVMQVRHAYFQAMHGVKKGSQMSYPSINYSNAL